MTQLLRGASYVAVVALAAVFYVTVDLAATVAYLVGVAGGFALGFGEAVEEMRR